MLADEPALWQIIKGELKQIAQTFGEPRRTRIEVPKAAVEFREEDYIVDEDAWVIVTRDGWTKRQKSFTDVASIRVRDDDRVGWVYRARARQTLTYFTDRGIAYTLRVNDIPMTTGHGEPIQKQFAFEDQEHIVSVICHDSRCLPDWTNILRHRRDWYSAFWEASSSRPTTPIFGPTIRTNPAKVPATAGSRACRLRPMRLR